VNRELHLKGNGFVVLIGIILPSKGALIRTLVKYSENFCDVHVVSPITNQPLLLMVHKTVIGSVYRSRKTGPVNR
jgi:hypothetical protein